MIWNKERRGKATTISLTQLDVFLWGPKVFKIKNLIQLIIVKCYFILRFHLSSYHNNNQSDQSNCYHFVFGKEIGMQCFEGISTKLKIHDIYTC